LSDPVANKLGSALYLEYALSTDEADVEAKLILDKQKGRFLNAINIVGELGTKKIFGVNGNQINAVNEGEFKFEGNYGWAYKINHQWNAGFELKSENEFENGKFAYSILSVGPAVSYATKGFWINFGLMPQLTNLKGSGPELHEHDGLQARLIFSYEF
jgi:hypothetical protein